MQHLKDSIDYTLCTLLKDLAHIYFVPINRNMNKCINAYIDILNRDARIIFSIIIVYAIYHCNGPKFPVLLLQQINVDMCPFGSPTEMSKFIIN